MFTNVASKTCSTGSHRKYAEVKRNIHKQRLCHRSRRPSRSSCSLPQWLLMLLLLMLLLWAPRSYRFLPPRPQSASPALCTLSSPAQCSSPGHPPKSGEYILNSPIGDLNLRFGILICKLGLKLGLSFPIQDPF